MRSSNAFYLPLSKNSSEHYNDCSSACLIEFPSGVHQDTITCLSIELGIEASTFSVNQRLYQFPYKEETIIWSFKKELCQT